MRYKFTPPTISGKELRLKEDETKKNSNGLEEISKIRSFSTEKLGEAVSYGHTIEQNESEMDRMFGSLLDVSEEKDYALSMLMLYNMQIAEQDCL